MKVAPTNLSAKLVEGQTIYNITQSPLFKLSSKGFCFDVVICDEVFLFTRTEMQIIDEITKKELILFGDPFQLQSISSA